MQICETHTNVIMNSGGACSATTRDGGGGNVAMSVCRPVSLYERVNKPV